MWRSGVASSQRRLRAGVLGLTLIPVLAGAVLIQQAGVDDGGDGAASVPSSAVPAVGRPMPDFRATTIDGRPVSLSEFRGRPVWLTFGATWCAPCRTEAPAIQSAQDSAGAEGLVVMAVYLSEDAAAVRDFAGRLRLRYRQIADPDRRIGSAYGVVGIPTHYFVDRSGVLRAIRNGELVPDQITPELAGIGA